MRLGDILARCRKSDAAPAPTKPVEMKVLGRDAAGTRVVQDARAVLAFVDDDERSEAVKLAERELRAAFPEGEVPAALLAEERTYQVLSKALRDEDDPRVPFAESARQLRAALHHLEFARLVQENEDFVRDEFPETPSTEQLEELVKDAEKNSLSALLSSYGLSLIRRALPLLAARSGSSQTPTSSASSPAA